MIESGLTLTEVSAQTGAGYRTLLRDRQRGQARAEAAPPLEKATPVAYTPEPNCYASGRCGHCGGWGVRLEGGERTCIMCGGPRASLVTATSTA